MYDALFAQTYVNNAHCSKMKPAVIQCCMYTFGAKERPFCHYSTIHVLKYFHQKGIFFRQVNKKCLCFVLFFSHQKGRGLIDKEDLQAVCHEFNLEISDKVLDDLMEYCDTDKDGFINFVEFANFLNWKNRMPISGQLKMLMFG